MRFGLERFPAGDLVLPWDRIDMDDEEAPNTLYAWGRELGDTENKRRILENLRLPKTTA